MNEKAIDSYYRINYLTASPLKLIALCYDQAIAHLKAARDAYARNDFATKGQRLTKVLDIIHELNVSLDLEQGGEIARNLRRLYAYMLRTLTDADLKRDWKAFDHIVKLLEELADAWHTISAEAIKEEERHPSPPPHPYGVRQAPTASARIWQV